MSCPNLKDIPFIPCYTPRKLTIDNAKPTMKEIMYLKNKWIFQQSAYDRLHGKGILPKHGVFLASFLPIAIATGGQVARLWYVDLTSSSYHKGTSHCSLEGAKAPRKDLVTHDKNHSHDRLTYKTGEFFVWSDISHLR